VGFGNHESLDSLLRDALGVLVERVGARETLIEVMGDDGAPGSHVVSHGCAGERLAAISSFVSRGIIGEAMATGKTVVTANAAEDPRFDQFESVQQNQLESVLCVPIGRDVPVGVVYLQGKHGAEDFRPYDEALRRDVETCAKALGGPVERLLVRGGVSAPTPAADRPASPDDPFSAVRGKSAAIRDLVDRLRMAAPLDIHVLLTGPSGSGKTLLARAIHLASPRRAARFVELNCAAIPEPLLENELFGAEPGAHSAVPRGGVKGKVEAAEEGTLFLDEIAELPLGAQAKLLQLLQSKTYYKLGDSEARSADVRVLAATNSNLKAAVADKRFREDLYYRLQVLEARVPSLAERPDDLIPLSVGFLRQAAERHHLPYKTLSPSAIRAIQVAQWPGNVRELANRIESATIHAQMRGSEWIEGRDVFPDAAEPGGADQGAFGLQEATRNFQRKHVQAVLDSTDWNVIEAAQVLDVSRSHVYNLIRAFELRRA
jgi:Nif-specific regulatory protein